MSTERLREDPLVPAGKRCKGKASKALLDAIDLALQVNEGERPQSIKRWRSELDKADDADTEYSSKVDDLKVTGIHNNGEDLGGDTSAGINAEGGREKYLASRSIRLKALLIDIVLGFVISAIPLSILVYIATDGGTEGGVSLYQLVIIWIIIALSTYPLLNVYFLVKRGQTLGKMLLRIRIVDASSMEIVSFWRVFVLRWLVWVSIGVLPILSIVTFLDPFFIFKRQRRCLHDYLADTIVVNITADKISYTASNKPKLALPPILAFAWILGAFIVIVTTIATLNREVHKEINSGISPDDILANIQWEGALIEDDLNRLSANEKPPAAATADTKNFYEYKNNGIKVPKEPLYLDLSKTMGFVIGQRNSLNYITENHPALYPRARIAESEFNLTFGVAEKNIERSLRNILMDEYPEYIATLEKEIKSIFESQQINRGFAIQFLDEVGLRARGEIPSPMLETLLHYQFGRKTCRRANSWIQNNIPDK